MRPHSRPHGRANVHTVDGKLPCATVVYVGDGCPLDSANSYHFVSIRGTLSTSNLILHTQEVTGSSPVAPTIFFNQARLYANKARLYAISGGRPRP